MSVVYASAGIFTGSLAAAAKLYAGGSLLMALAHYSLVGGLTVLLSAGIVLVTMTSH